MDYERHLFSAYDLYDEGKYGAAIYDALYVYELYSADQELIDMGQDELNGVLFSLSNQTRFSLWGKIYQTQGQYLAQGDLASKMSGFRILKYSKALDEVNVQMKVSSIGIDLESIFCLPELFFFLLFSYLVIHKH